MSHILFGTVEAFILVLLFIFVFFNFISVWLEKLHNKK